MKRYGVIIDYLKDNLSRDRFTHTLGVYDECNYFADIFGLKQSDRDLLSKAALFHDITKEKTPEEQCELCRVYNIEYDEAYLSTPALFHSLTGGYYAKELFPAFCDEEIIGIIKTHTTGGEKMTLLQKLLFLADSTEATRKHASCIELRNAFHNNVTDTNKEELLDRVMIEALDNTICHLIKTARIIDPNTVRTRNQLIKKARLQNE